MVDRELLMMKNRVAEAENKRVAAENRAMKLSAQLDNARRALGEGIAILTKLYKADIYDSMGFLVSKDGRAKFSKSEFVHGKNLLSGARANIAPKMEVGDATPIRTRIPDSPTKDPKTNDWYIDENGTLFVFYLGRWNKGNE